METTEAWCILRTAGRSTITLAESLAKDGFDGVWTPVADENTPMLASYVFASVRHLHRLIALVRSPSLQYRVWDPEVRRMVVRGHPTFSLMRGLDQSAPWALVSDAQLEPLRRIEKRRKPRGIVKVVDIGARVRVDDPAFGGMIGTVESVTGKIAKVTFPGYLWPLDVGCWNLTEELDESRCDGVRWRSEQAKAA